MNDQPHYEQTPLFQLNLMLWLVWSSDHSGIKPVFREEGFRLKSVGQPLPLPFPLRARITEEGIDIQDSASPDLLLEHSSTTLLLPLECKSHGFSPNSSDVRQANCLLCNDGQHIAQNIGMEQSSDWKAHLYYVVADDDQHPMLETLNTLTAKLESRQIVCSTSGSIGIRVNLSEAILLEFCNEIEHIDSSGFRLRRGWVEVKKLRENESPEPLYLLPVDLTSGKLTDVAIRSLEERLRSAFAALVVQNLGDGDFLITEDQLMSTAIEVWEYWKEENLKAGLLKAVRPYLRSVIKELDKGGISVKYANRAITFSDVNSERAKEIRRFFRRKEFRTEETNMRQPLKDFSQLPLPFRDDDFTE